MKVLLFLYILLIPVTSNAQNKDDASDTVIKLFFATDQREWHTLEKCFYKKVEIDYSSMNGNPPSVLTAKDIITNWKEVLPGFKFTHHQIGNIIIKIFGEKASVFCYGTATHYLENEKGNTWTVYGTYDFELIKEADEWLVSKMKFNYKFQDGNPKLPNLAIDKLKKK